MVASVPHRPATDVNDVQLVMVTRCSVVIPDKLSTLVSNGNRDNTNDTDVVALSDNVVKLDRFYS